MPIISTFPTGESTVDYVGPKSGLPALKEGKVGYATDEKHLYTGNADGQNTQIPNSDDLKMHTDNGDIHVTAEEKAVWDKSVVIGEEKTLIKLPLEENGNTICYGGDKFVVGGKGIMAYSNDSMRWNKVSVLDPREEIFEFLYGGTRFIGNLLRSNKYLYSTNGIDWNVNRFPTESHLYRVCYGNGKYVFLNSDNGIVFPISERQLNIVIENEYGYPLPQNDASWSTICFGDGKFVVVSDSGSKAAYSSDGINWTETTMIEGENWVKSCYGNGKFVAISETETFAAYSEDGINWNKADLPSGATWISVCYGAGKFVAISATNGIAAYSTDGISWNQTTLPSDMPWFSVCFGNGRFVAVQKASESSEPASNALHGDRIIAYSTDGVTWTSEALLPTIENISGESSIESVKSALHYTPEEIGAESKGMAMRYAEDMIAYLEQQYADKTEVSDAVDSHNLAEDAHAAKFAEKQDKIKGKAGKYIGFTADDTVGEVSAPISGGSRLTIHFDNAFVGQVWTLSGGGETYTGTVDSTLTVTVGVLGVNTTYTVECTLSGISYTTEITTADYYTALSVELIKFQSTITVTIDSGSTVTASLGDTVFTEISDGTAVLTVNKAGSWAIKATKDSKTASGMVTINANGQSKTLTLIYVPIYGASWDGTSTTKRSRTDDAATFVDPVPYTEGAEKYGSPFDELLPWAGMVKSERVGGTMVAIPKFWYKLTQNGKSLKIQIASKPTAGFSVSPAHVDRGDGKGERDVVYVGRYHCNYNYKSVTGDSPQTLINRSTARSSIHAIGENIWQADFVLRFTLWLLYIVEFANWDSQGCIGFGCGNGGDAHKTGGTDTMPYHTGVPATYLSYSGSAQYRYIEGLWDSCYDWCDGCYNSSDGFNIILNPNNFNDSKNGVSVGIPMSGYPSAFIVNAVPGLPALFIPTEKNGSKSSYTCDSWGFGSSSPCVYVGGCYSQLEVYGLFYISYGTSSYSEDSIGCRLQELP